MFKALFLTLVGATTVLAQTRNNFVYSLGTTFSDFSRGFCDVWVDDAQGSATSCSESCEKTSVQIQNLFDNLRYTSAAFNTPDALKQLQTVSNAFLIQFKNCRTDNWFFNVYNRLSDMPFTYGLIGNIGSQILTYVPIKITFENFKLTSEYRNDPTNANKNWSYDKTVSYAFL